MDTKDCWIPDAERLARETDDLLRFGSRVLAGLTVIVAAVLVGVALW